MKFGLSYLLYMHSDLSFKLLFLKQTLIGNIGKFKKLFNNPFFSGESPSTKWEGT